MRTFFWSPEHKASDEDALINEVLLTAVGDEHYPGASTPSIDWPGIITADAAVESIADFLGLGLRQ